VHLVIVSDTHARHEELGQLCGDVLIHCGDGCDGFQRNREDLECLDDWFGRQQFERILCIGGNHDFLIEERIARGERVFRNAIYLQDETHEFRGLRFYGSPWTPELIGWAFHLDAGGLRSRWSSIPEDTAVVNRRYEIARGPFELDL
jgi:hypothetical protein